MRTVSLETGKEAHTLTHYTLHIHLHITHYTYMRTVSLETGKEAQTGSRHRQPLTHLPASALPHSKKF